MSTAVLFEVYGTNMMLLGYVAGHAAFHGFNLTDLVTRVSCCSGVLELSQDEIVCLINSIDKLLASDRDLVHVGIWANANSTDLHELRNRLVGALP